MDCEFVTSKLSVGNATEVADVSLTLAHTTQIAI